MRKIAMVCGIVFALVIVAVLIFWATFDVNRYHDRIVSELESRVGRKVSLGKMHLGLLPPSFQVENVAIADDPGFGNPKPFVQANKLSVSVQLFPLLGGNVAISGVDLNRPTVELVKDRRGEWNFSTVGAKGNAAAGKVAGGGTPAGEGGGGQQFSLSRLSIKDGQVAITDRESGHPRAVYDHIDATLEDFAPGQPFSVDLAAHLPGAGKEEIRLKGTGGPMAQEAAATPFHGTLDLEGVSLAGLQQFLNNEALNNSDGIISGKTKVDTDAGKLSASGQTTIDKAKLRGLDVGYAINSQYDLSDDLRADLITIRDMTLKLGSTPISVTGTVNTKPTPAQLNLDLKANNVSIAEAARLASAFGVAFAPGSNVAGRLNANIRATGAADKPALNGTLSAQDVQVTGKDIPQPVQVKAVNLALTPEEIHSDTFNITSGGTNVSTNFALRQYTSNAPFIAATAQAPNAELPAVLAMAKAWGVKGLERVTGSGTLNLNMHIAEPVKAITGDEIMRALNGTLNLNFNNMKVSGVDVSHQLASIAGLMKSSQKDLGYTAISKMTGNIVVTNGVAQTSNLQALLDIGNVGATGTANLASQALNLAVTAVLSKTTSQQVGGAGVGGLMNTALANNQGEIVIPVLVRGTFQNPQFAPDLQKIAQMRLKGVLPSFDNPAGGASGVLGGLLGQKSGQQGQQQNAVQQLLGGFLGGKKQPPPPKKP